jgi:hypothetical protein
LHTPPQYFRAKKPFFGGLVKYFCAGPIVAMCWEGLGVIATGRLLLGATNPKVSLILNCLVLWGFIRVLCVHVLLLVPLSALIRSICISNHSDYAG